MKTIYSSDLKAHLSLDEKKVRHIRHGQECWPSEQTEARLAANDYLNAMADTLQIPKEQLKNLNKKVSFLDPCKQGIEYHLSEEKHLFDSFVIGYYQTYMNVPVWRRGLSVKIKQNPNRVVSMTNNSEDGIQGQLPDAGAIERYRKILGKADAYKSSDTGSGKKEGDGETLSFVRSIINVKAPTANAKSKQPSIPSYDETRLLSGKFFFYKYDPDKRYSGTSTPSDESITRGISNEEHSIPIPKLPSVPDVIRAGQSYLVAEIIFTDNSPGFNGLVWLILVEPETGSVLYIECMTCGVNGLVFQRDPIVKTGNLTITSGDPNAILNSHRDDVLLTHLDPPVAGIQHLRGTFVDIQELTVNHADPDIAPPTEPNGTDFDYDARTDNFGGVNAYYHQTELFKRIEDLGFPIAMYFDGTTFPIPVDHRSSVEDGFAPQGNTINAHWSPNGTGGTGHMCYALCDTTNTVDPLLRAVDPWVHWHEMGGHGTLGDHVGNGSFGFAHSAGDGLAAIQMDPESELRALGLSERFRYAPFRPFTIERRFDRPVNTWAWGSAVVLTASGDLVSGDDGIYGSEQILATCHFRIYRSIGGDHDNLSRRQFASRMVTYLILRTIGNLTPGTNPTDAQIWCEEMQDTDLENWTTEGLSGGAYNKVIRWTFEMQGSYQPAGAPTPVTTRGAPPLVDVYIDDGRAGEYEFQAVHWENMSVWNRLMADGLEGHQEPTVGTNYAYVKIKNRGTSVANDIIVKAYHCKPSAGLVWPDDLQPMTISELSAGTLQPNNSEEKIIGPFEWAPNENAVGHDSMLMIVSATGDPSNVDNFIAGEEIEDWRLVPNDNNIGLRNVRLEPRLVTVIADDGNFGDVCIGSFKDMVLSLSNSGYNMLAVTNITSSSPAEFLVPSVLSYPITIEAGNAIEIPIRLQPNSLGAKAGTITVFSNDPNGPKSVEVSGTVRAPRLVAIIANAGNFGNACIGSFVDELVTLSNSGHCTLTITSITSSSAEFLVPNVLAYPITIGAGGSLQVPIQFEPTSFGPKAGTITIISDDPAGPKGVPVSGNAPSGKLVITGSTCIGGVKACCLGERTISICNVGDCKLNVTSVAFKRKSMHWKLINNPFPATLMPGSCLSLLIRYKATEKCPRCCELIITSDDPETPVKILDVMAYTIWGDCGSKNCDDCRRGCCEKHHDGSCIAQGIDACCEDENHDHEDDDDDEG